MAIKSDKFIFRFNIVFKVCIKLINKSIEKKYLIIIEYLINEY